MFQDIAPHQINTEYQIKVATDNDNVIIINNGKLLMVSKGNHFQIPTLAELIAAYTTDFSNAIYLLSIEEQQFFYCDVELDIQGEFSWQPLITAEHIEPQQIAFTATVALHLAVWYQNDRYCGRCGHLMQLGTKERSLVCPNCHQIEFPKIAPAIIVGVRQQDQLLLTKYNTGYDRYALIAGFVEIGETLEDTVRREVFEETGMEVEHIQYYKSQPWPFSQSVLMGFFADITTDDAYTNTEYHRDEAELASAQWFDRDQIPRDDTTFSLTWDMIEAFREHRDK